MKKKPKRNIVNDLILNCTIAENYRNKSNKKSFYEYRGHIGHGVIKTITKPFEL